MITLPNECYHEIFNNLRYNYKNLFSCALVNRQWCKFIIPILWSEPEYYFRDTRIIRICLLTLNAEEQASLIPFNINFPSHPKPLFEYTSYITSVDGNLSEGIKNWFPYNIYSCELGNAVKSSLIAMFLRTCKNLKHFYLDEIICNPIILEYFYNNTTVTSIDFRSKSKSIDGLVNILYKKSTLTSLNFKSIQLGTNGMKILLETLDKNTSLNSLGFGGKWIGTEEGKIRK
ncbi:hypothetical protein F8M41_022754 [Gigaspora margarita]|uniref:F-box domain-containing protein n=1 Tax=Gigaspora margarita TaxID=4874 RepID=A0A8H4EHQ4_GIGMA|nr:hypothetical protein F8M41_022754 [Gigaspora margarita]